MIMWEFFLWHSTRLHAPINIEGSVFSDPTQFADELIFAHCFVY